MTAPVAPVHASADLAAASPPRRLTQWTGAAAVVGVVIGSGIFRVPTGVAQLAPEPLAILALWLFGGLLAVELIFNYNGLGRELVRAATSKDLPVLSAGVLVIGVVYMIATLLGDILISILNPRVRLGDQ